MNRSSRDANKAVTAATQPHSSTQVRPIRLVPSYILIRPSAPTVTPQYARLDDPGAGRTAEQSH